MKNLISIAKLSRIMFCVTLVVVTVSAAPKPRLVVLTDIGGDPDDQMSMVRLMTYANHPPVVKLDHPAYITAKPKERVDLSATRTTDPDGDALSYKWFQLFWFSVTASENKPISI